MHPMHINFIRHTLKCTQFIRHTLKDLKAHIDSNTVIVGDFNAPLSPDKKSTKKS
jgi:endonuclease/exonuclease/phosphatase family metal-dependent hydrolase